jgi:hypothetical protein
LGLWWHRLPDRFLATLHGPDARAIRGTPAVSPCERRECHVIAIRSPHSAWMSYPSISITPVKYRLVIPTTGHIPIIRATCANPNPIKSSIEKTVRLIRATCASPTPVTLCRHVGVFGPGPLFFSFFYFRRALRRITPPLENYERRPRNRQRTGLTHTAGGFAVRSRIG